MCAFFMHKGKETFKLPCKSWVNMLSNMPGKSVSCKEKKKQNTFGILPLIALSQPQRAGQEISHDAMPLFIL